MNGTLNVFPGDWRDLDTQTVALSIIIASRNDPLLPATLHQLKNTAPEAEILVADDASTVPILLAEDQPGRVIRFDERQGCGVARTLAAREALGDWLLFTDGHMIFPDNWTHAIFPILVGASECEIFCSTFVSLDSERLSMLNPRCIVGGQTPFFWRANGSSVEIMGGTLREPMESDGPYPVPSMCGACYFIRKSWFHDLLGFDGLRDWSSDDIFFSLKTWLAGGRVCVVPNLFVGHIAMNRPLKTDRVIERVVAPADTQFQNRLFALWCLVSDAEWKYLGRRIGRVAHALGAMEAVQTPTLGTLRDSIRERFIHETDYLAAHWGIQSVFDL